MIYSMDNNNTNSWYSPLESETPSEPVAEVHEVQNPADDEEQFWDSLIEENDADSSVKSPAAQEKKKKTGGFWPVLAVILAVIVLLAASLAVFGRFSFKKSNSSIQITYGTGDEQHDFSINPESDFESIFGNDDEEDDKDDDSDAESGMPNDKDEFFAGYYTGSDTVDVDICMERAKVPVNFELKLEEPTGQELTLQDLYANCSKSVVAILGYKDGAEYSWGTGIVLSSKGLIITNTHVIDGCDRTKVILWNDDEYEALLVGADATSDIAVLQIDADRLPAARYCNSDSLVVGDRVVAIGNPLGESFRATLTDGIISGIDRGVSYNGRTMTVLQTNTALNSGNSGGPLFNIYGQVVGITNMKMMSSYSSIEGIGFAIPTKTVLQIVNGLVKDGEFRGRTSIGMTVGSIPDNAKEQYSLPSGLYVTDVTEGSGAEKAGIKPGDIVTKVNGIEVTKTDEVLAIKDEFAVGDMLPITIWRDGKIIEVEVELMDTNDVYG